MCFYKFENVKNATTTTTTCMDKMVDLYTVPSYSRKFLTNGSDVLSDVDRQIKSQNSKTQISKKEKREEKREEIFKFQGDDGKSPLSDPRRHRKG